MKLGTRWRRLVVHEWVSHECFPQKVQKELWELELDYRETLNISSSHWKNEGIKIIINHKSRLNSIAPSPAYYHRSATAGTSCHTFSPVVSIPLRQSSSPAINDSADDDDDDDDDEDDTGGW